MKIVIIEGKYQYHQAFVYTHVLPKGSEDKILWKLLLLFMEKINILNISIVLLKHIRSVSTVHIFRT